MQLGSLMLNRVRVVARRWGRRGFFLASFGALSLLISLGSLLDPPTAAGQADASVITFLAPLTFWYVMIALCALTCFVASFWKRLEKVAFTMYVALYAFFGLGYMAAQLIGVEGMAHPWSIGALFLGFAAAGGVIAGWRENSE